MSNQVRDRVASIVVVIGLLLIGLICLNALFSVNFLQSSSSPRPPASQELDRLPQLDRVPQVNRVPQVDRVPDLDRARVERGKRLFMSILDRHPTVDPDFRNPSLWGALTDDPLAEIRVPLVDWERLTPDEVQDLEHYAASLVPMVKTSPFEYSGIPASAPAADLVRRNANRMSPTSWVIAVGNITEDGRVIPADRIVRRGKAPLPPSPPDSDDWVDRPSPELALGFMQQKVRERLRSPSTAKFPSSMYADRQTRVRYLGDQRYRIEWWVDAQNAFGAMLRVDYVGEVRQVQRNRWLLLDLQMDQR